MMIDECVAYFKARPEFDRVFKLLKKQWRSYGAIAGYIILTKPTTQEKAGLGKFLHQDYSYPRDLGKIKFKMSAFEQALAITKFKDLDLKDIIEAYFQVELISNKEKKNIAASRKEDLFFRLSQSLTCEPVRDWFATLWHNKNSGYALINTIANQSETAAFATLEAIDKAARCLDGTAYPLAVLGATVTGNPHYFDRDTKQGRLLINYLAFAYNTPTPSHAQGILELYALARITPDDITSSVVVKNIDLIRDGMVHPGMAGFNEIGEPCVLTLGNLAHVSRVVSPPFMFIFENQMVFSHLASENFENCSLVCTSGQLKVAALKLLEMVDPKVKIYYSGDFDPEGLGICDKLCGRFENVIPWGFENNLYLRAMSQEKISEVRLAKLDSLNDVRLQELARSIKEHQKAGYQENILDFYVADITRITTNQN